LKKPILNMFCLHFIFGEPIIVFGFDGLGSKWDYQPTILKSWWNPLLNQCWFFFVLPLHIWVKAWNKKPWSVWTILKMFFLKIWKITTGTLNIKQIVQFLKSILILSKLQLQNFHENSSCFKSPFICLKLSIKTCGQMVFLFQKSIFLMRCSPNPFSFLWTLIYSTRKDPCVQNIQEKNINTLLNFDTQTSLNIIIVLNL
jgi:hypothetical protein